VRGACSGSRPRSHTRPSPESPHLTVIDMRLRGFTLVEMMVVISVIAILALIALPTYTDKRVRDQVLEAMALGDIAKPPVSAAWALGQPLPVDNAAAGLPAADKIVSSFVSSVAVQDGAIHIRFGNQANTMLRGKTLSLRPAVVQDVPVVPIAWICGKAPIPDKMTVKGTDRTDVPSAFLPLRCR
jgi:type IV pilus assembly protein PilA